MTRELKTATIVAVTVLFFASGSAALVYEVLWMKELSLLFGNSAQAAAVTLAAFFAGIAAGNAYWGRRASGLSRPLRVYGVLELGIAFSALLYFGVFYLYGALYTTLFDLLETAPIAFVFTKFFLSFMLFFPAAFFMGGTLPIMTQFLVYERQSLGKRASMIYAINTFGAATGAMLAGFVLPQTFGYRTAYLGTMVVTVIVAAIAIAIDNRAPPHSVRDNEADGTTPAANAPGAHKSHDLTLLAVLSGFGALALQVLWIRMFAQVLHNSVYTYAAILSVFLLALALGGVIAREMARRRLSADQFLPILLSLTAVLVGASPLVFNAMTGGGQYVGGDANFAAYIGEIVLLAGIAIGIPVTALGTLLPYLFKLAEQGPLGPGETVGRLVSSNTVAAIFGSLAAGFVLLGWLGLWASIRLIALLYIAAAVWVVMTAPPKPAYSRLAPIMGLLLLATVLDTARLPIVRFDPVTKNETLLKVWEGADATVAVVRQDGYLRTKLNNWYALGSTGDMTTQRVQTHLPMLLHANPKRVFYLGLGTGITAGTALDYPIDQVVVTEIAPSVVRASREFFGEYTNGLYTDTRVKMIADDGRNALRGIPEAYDLIISDLFVPWKSGTGTLYAVEHYQTALTRLNPGGMYAQWIPLYQLTSEEFAIIARSMTAVFPNVTLWRGNFSSDRAVVALMGHRDPTPLGDAAPIISVSRLALNDTTLPAGDRVPLLAHYAGSLHPEDLLIASAPLNTDNLPVIEHLAPINHRLEKAGLKSWFVGEDLLALMATYVGRERLAEDPYLMALDPGWYDTIQAGYYLQVSRTLAKESDVAEAKRAYEAALRRAARTLNKPPRQAGED